MIRRNAGRAGFLLLLLASLTRAQPLTWQDITGTPGFDVLERSSTGVIFATNRRGVVYASTDNGRFFPSILAYPSSTQIFELAVNGDHAAVRIIDPNVTNSYQLLVWNNHPDDWTRIFNTPFPYYQNPMINDSGFTFAVDPFDGGFNRGRIVRFDGISWNSVGTDQPFLFDNNGDSMFVDAIDHANNIIVGRPNGGIYVSTNYGQTWRSSLLNYSVSAIDVTLPNQILIGTVPSTTLHTFGGIFASSDSGLTWRGLGLSNLPITSVAARSTGSLFALAGGGVYKRIEATGEWRLQGPAGRVFTSLVLIGADTIIASSESAGLFQSTDDGATWSGDELRGKDAFAIQESPAGNLFAGTLGTGLFRSAPGQLGWTRVAPGSTGDYVYSLAIAGGTVYAGTNSGLYRTTDEGVNWGNLSSSISGSIYAVASAADGSLLTGTGYGIQRSTDAGVSWSQAGLAGSKVFFMAASPDGNIYAGTSSGGIYASTDNGATWAGAGLTRGDLQTIAVNSLGHVFAGVYGGTFRSTNQGLTWDNVSFTNGYVYSLLFNGPQTVYAGTYNGVYASPNEGGTWSAAGDSGLAQSVVLALAMNDQNHVLAGTYRGGVYRSVRQAAPSILNGVEGGRGLPLSTGLSQNYPNPFNPQTELAFAIRNPEHVSLRVYDLLGREVASLVDKKLEPGSYHVSWDAAGRPSGVYYYRLIAGGFSAAKKMLLLR
jgi:ligand-binding sensor domain-containing protein